jgi:hypothetical protein
MAEIPLARMAASSASRGRGAISFGTRRESAVAPEDLETGEDNIEVRTCEARRLVR